MEDSLRKYLEWRFMANNHPKYRKYFNQWVENINGEQLSYFEREMTHMIEDGKYNG